MWLVAACVAVVISTANPGVLQAQAAAGGQAAQVPETPVPLKVTVTISRAKDGKETARLPFELWVNAESDGARAAQSQASLRMNSDVPVPGNTVKDGMVVDTYSYRPVGTQIDCWATNLGNGQYRIRVSVQDSQVFRTFVIDGSPQSGSPRPTIQNFQSVTHPILRDGQTVQHVVASDKISGELITLTIGLALVK
jgi:hypothetical protein